MVVLLFMQLNQSVKILNVLLIFTMFLSLGYAANSTFTMNFYQSDGATSYFCNPCYYKITNATATVYDRTTSYGDTNEAISLKEDTYNIEVTAEISGSLNLSLQTFEDQIHSGSTSINVNFSEIENRGQIAFIGYSSQNNWYSGLPSDIYNKPTYSENYFKNVTKSLGYSTINTFNAGSAYDVASTSISSSAFNSYDVLVITPESVDRSAGLMSTNVRTAVLNAINNGVKVIISSNQYRAIASHLATMTTTGNIDHDMSMYIYGGQVYTTDKYPDGTYAKTEAGYTYYPDGRSQESVSGQCRLNMSYSSQGLSSYIRNIYYSDDDTDEVLTAALYQNLGNYYVVPTYWTWCTASYYENLYSPVDRALIYVTLNDFVTSGADRFNVSFLPKLDSCGVGFDSVEGVTCQIDDQTCTSSGRTEYLANSNQILTTYGSSAGLDAYSSALTPPESYNKDIDTLLYSIDEDVYSGSWFTVWKNHHQGFLESTQYNKDKPMFFYGRVPFSYNFGNISQIMIFANSNTNPTNEEITNNQIYTYISRNNVTNVSFTSSPRLWYDNQFRYYLTNDGFTSPLPSQHKSCTTNHNWNLTYYTGKNNTHFFKNSFYCDDGVSGQLAQIDVTSDGVPTALINRSSIIPVKVEQVDLGEYKITREQILHFRANEDMDQYHYVGVIDDNVTIHDRSRVVTDSVCNMEVYGGDKQVTCYAPAGYSFSNTGSYIYTDNISVDNQMQNILLLQQDRVLAINMYVYEQEAGSPKMISGATCQISGYTALSDTNGRCYLPYVSPLTEYVVNITYKGNKRSFALKTGNYYDTTDADDDGKKCGAFDGNFSYYVDISAPQQLLTLKAVYPCNDKLLSKANVLINVNGQSCLTNNKGICSIYPTLAYIGGSVDVSTTNGNGAVYEIDPQNISIPIRNGINRNEWDYKTSQTQNEIVCSDGWDTCYLGVTVNIVNASDINCDSSEFWNFEEDDDNQGFMAALMALPLAFVSNGEAMLIFILLIFVEWPVIYVLRHNIPIAAIVGLTVFMFACIGASDVIMGSGNGIISNNYLALVLFIGSAVISGLMYMIFKGGFGD